jgi:sulfate adenylyltransferase
VLGAYPEQTTTLSLLNLAMRMAGPREAIWHAIIRKNYGCTHLIVGRDHASPGNDRNGEPFYGPYDAQELYRQHEHELDITMVPFKTMVYVENKAEYTASDETEPGDKVLELSGSEFRRRLREGLEIPEWFSFPKVVDELRRAHPPRHEQGFTVFFTGLSGSGKSTVANALMVKLLEDGSRPVTLLDGDIVRKNLSSELTFSKEHRDLNIQRIGFVASEITKNRGIAICAPIAPYAHTRRLVRETIGEHGGFIEVFVATPLEVCEARDRKGLYAKARAGILKGFTGIDDPYEEPENPEIVIDTQELSPDLAAHRILITLEKLGYLR